jgi:hypothetical protein
MNKILSKDQSLLQRCAVCKIDLKGRFAFIDEEFLNLTGYSYEDLLGKPLSGVLDATGQELIHKLLSGRSHYETVYDSAPLTLIDKNQRTLRVSAIMFLNFIGGNPVNFQLIISSQRFASINKENAQHEATLEVFIKELSTIDATHDWPGILMALLKLSSAGQAAWYGFDKGSLIPMATAVDDSQAKFAAKEISQISSWHLKVAENEEEYDFTDGESIRKAVEASKEAPNEFISTFQINKDKFLLRLVFADDIDPSQAAPSISRTKLVIPLIRKLVSESK